MGRRRQARELALQALYLADAARMSGEEAYKIVRAGSEVDAKAEAFSRELVLGTLEHQGDLDARISRIAENWDLERMAVVDRSILRMASYELLHCPDTPVGVVIDEALEIAKAYSSEDSSRFINGILDKVKASRA